MSTVFKYLSYLLFLSGSLRVLPLSIAIYYHESITTIIVGSLLSFILAALMYLISKLPQLESNKINFERAIILAALSFIIIPLTASISYLPYTNFNWLNAFFESVSGFTTTGLTVFNNYDLLPKNILVWRSMTQWIGGIGIIIIFLFLFQNKQNEHLEDEHKQNLAIFKSSGFYELIETDTEKSITKIVLIYGFYTLLGITLLYFSGLNLIESLGLTFSSISTGGFSLNSQFQPQKFQAIILIALMIIGAIPFSLHNKILKKKIKEFFTSQEKNYFFAIIAIISLVFVFNGATITDSIFQAVSALSTTGFSNMNISTLPAYLILLIIAAMIIGGNTASTAGGIKINRIVLMFKSIAWYLKKIVSPYNSIIPLKNENKILEEEDVIGIHVFITSYFLIATTSIIVLILTGISSGSAIFHVFSALGTVGLQTTDLTQIHFLAKLVLISCMIFGRLEIFPLFILIRKILGNTRNYGN